MALKAKDDLYKYMVKKKKILPAKVFVCVKYFTLMYFLMNYFLE